MKKLALLLPAVILVLSVCMASFTAVSAGMSNVEVVTDDSFEGEIMQNRWYFTGGVEYGNNSVVFGENSSADSRIIARRRIDDVGYYGREVAVSAEAVFSIEEFGPDAAFMVGFGLRTAAAYLASVSTTTVYFQNGASGIECGVYKTDENEIRQDICAAQPFDSNALGGEISLSVEIGSNGDISVGVNGTQICDAAAAAPFEGYFGFGQSGATRTEITSVNVISGAYDRPETPAVCEENFDDGEFNALEWYAFMNPGYFSPTNQYVGEGRLNFVNTAQASMCTMFQYSNFLLDFDIPYIQRESEFVDGIPVSSYSGWIGVSMGAPDYMGGATTMLVNATMIRFQPTSSDNTVLPEDTILYLTEYGTTLQTVSLKEKGYHLWDPANDGKIISCRLSVEDGLIELWLKYDTEEEYTKVLSYDLGYTPLGYVGFLAMGHFQSEGEGLAQSGQYSSISAGNFALDNLRIENKDKDANTVEVGYVSNKEEMPADYVYNDTWEEGDLLENQLVNGTYPSSDHTGLIVGLSAGGAVVVAGGSAAAVAIVKKRRKGHESEQDK